MYVEELVRNIKTVQNSFAAIAALLQLTSYRYPLAEIVADGATYDYIVVGGGTAGSVVASRLSEDPSVSVLLIEAGGDPPLESNLPGIWGYLPNTSLDWNHTSQIDGEAFQCFQDDQLRLNHGRVLGGTSSINGMYYVRGDPNDYDTWARITCDKSWSYSNVLTYFKKSERLEEPSVINSWYGRFHGVNGQVGVTKLNKSEADNYLDAIMELGYNSVLDVNGDKTLGFTQQMLTLADGIRQGSANAFLSPIKGRPNLRVMKESLATKIVVDRRKKARAVIVSDKIKKTITVKARKEIIVSAGAINTPQLLMLSGIGPKEKLRGLNIDVVSDLPVGEKLQDHRFINLIIKMNKSNVKKMPLNPHTFPSTVVVGFVALNSSQPFPDYQASLTGVTAEGLVLFCANIFAWKIDICKYIYEETKERDTLLIMINNFDAKPRGHISLKSSNPDDYPSVYMNPFPDDVDLNKYVSYIKDITRLVNTTYFRSVGAELLKLPQCSGFEDGSRRYWECYLRCLSAPGLHFAGSCAMGSVVDSQLRVRGVAGLRVADASVMPTITSGNTMVPTIMIGEKAADMIKQDNYFT